MRGQPNLDDYLQKGIYGEKQTKPEERRKFLGTLRERIIVALTKSQVMETAIYPEIEEVLKQAPKAKLLLNGELTYSAISKYIHLAKKYGNSYSIVSNNHHTTSIGLVLAFDYAVNNKEIYLSKKDKVQKKKLKKVKPKNEGIFSSIKKTFIKKK